MTQPRQNDPQFKLRVPELVHAEIMRSAAANNRSMNAEIVARLEASGESLRDRFAGQALAGLMGQQSWGKLTADNLNRFETGAAHTMAAFAYQLADAMLAERSKGRTA